MKVLILRSMVFADDINIPTITSLVEGYKKAGHDVAVYNMPAADDAEHWAGYSIVDYSNLSDMLICIDFPTALIQHKNKRIILTKPLTEKKELQKAVNTAIEEAFDCYKFGDVNLNCDIFPNDINEYINRGDKI